MRRALRTLRVIEELVRRGLFTLCTRLSNRAGEVGPHDLHGRPLRVLYIMEDALGDTILTLPSIRAIAESHPGTVVDVATWDGPAELLAGAPYVRRVIRFPRYDRRRWNAARLIARHGPYDAVVDGMVLRGHVRSRSFAMMLASRARYWIGEWGRGSDYLLNILVAPPSATTTHLDRMIGLAQPFLTRSPDRRPRLTVRRDERDAAESMWGRRSRGSRILVNVSTNGPERRWPASRFAAVVQHLRRRRPAARIIVVSLGRDREAAEIIAAAGRAEAHVPDIRALTALIASADVVFSPDTSVCHIASAFERPLVSIHNAGKQCWHPYDTPGRRVISISEESIESVSTREVLRAIDATLADLAAKAPPTADASRPCGLIAVGP